MRQHGFPDARGLHGLTPAAPTRSRCRLLALDVSAGTARFRQLSETMRKIYARRELFSLSHP